MRRVHWIVGVIAVCSLSAPALADTVDDVIKKLDETFTKLKSFSMKVKMDYAAEGTKMQSESSLEFARKDGKELMRSESESKTDIKTEGFESKMLTKSLSVLDGQFSWSLMEHLEGPQKGLKQAFKQPYQPQTASPKHLKDQGDLKLLPDEKVDGADCHVIEVTLKAQPNTKSINYFRKADGITAKSVTMEGGKQVGSMTTSDIKVNPDIPAERFVFKAPEGVQVQDMTGGPPTTPATPDKP